MKTINLLNIYHDLMNLYGDWANIKTLELELTARGYEVVVDKKSVGDEFNVNAYDFVYIGSGTERSLIACLSDIMRYKDSFISCIENGTHILATGNSHELFGRAITDTKGERHRALDLLNFETIQGDRRITGDCVCKASFLQDKLIGFINRASQGQTGDIPRPFELELGTGADDKSKKEGIQYNNLLGTYMTGPILVRNPPLMKYFADKLANGITDRGAQTDGDTARMDGNTKPNSFFAFQETAYQKALIELLARVKIES